MGAPCARRVRTMKRCSLERARRAFLPSFVEGCEKS